MVESAGGRGRAGPGPPPARRRRRRGELSAARAARLPAHPRPCPRPGRSHGFPKRWNEVRFLGPVASGCGGCLRGSGRPGAAGLGASSPRESSQRCLRFLLITLEEALRAEKDHLALEHLFLGRVSPFPNTAELVAACFGNAETSAHT